VVNVENYHRIIEELNPYKAKLIAVSKTKPIEDILQLSCLGQKAFGENYVQELLEKQKQEPGLEWHFIGHLQSNKAKVLAPFITLIHGIDSLKNLKEVNKESLKANRIQDCLLEIQIAKEETKSGLPFAEAEKILLSDELKSLKNISIRGFMGMATFTDDENIISSEFKSLRLLFEKYKTDNFNILSMGMTSDYKIALEEGSTMVRIGSAIFGGRV
jgi:pyridoxal phosphate enzyme (YggS family)